MRKGGDEMSLGYRLKKLREEKNWHLEKVASFLNVSIPTISNYERDYRKPDIDTINKLADIFDVSTDYLLGRTDDRDVYVLTGDNVPEELRNVGIEEIGILKEFKNSGFTKEEIREIIEFAKKMKKQP